MNERELEWPLPRCSLYQNKHEGKNLSIPKSSLVVCGCRKSGEAEKGKVQSEVERSCCHGFVQCFHQSGCHIMMISTLSFPFLMMFLARTLETI